MSAAAAVDRLLRARDRAGLSLGVSVVAHGALMAAIFAVAYHFSGDAPPPPPADPPKVSARGPNALVLPGVSDGSFADDVVEITAGEAPAEHGGEVTARIDQAALGRGGTATSPRAVNLADADDAMRASPDPMSHLERDQHQRLASAQARASREDRRATTHPMELTFLATGTGERAERRPSAAFDPSRGSLVAPPAAVLGGALGGDVDVGDGPGREVGASRDGSTSASPGVGVRDGAAGERHGAAARIAYARPAVAEGPPSVTASSRGRPSDTLDSDQQVAAIVQAQVHASFAGGLVGPGVGGAAAAGSEAGAGGTTGRGSSARPLGAGDGEIFDWYTSDPLLFPYLRKVHAKVDPLWRDAFPRSAMAELKQGTVILEITIGLDGAARVSWPPLRPSGIDEFDRNCADAVRRASPFDPLPAALRERGRTTLRLRAPFVAKNPIVK